MKKQGVIKTITYGMVGGGEGSFIGEVHRHAIGLDGQALLQAGCFSRDLKKTISTGQSLSLDRDRLYASYTEMAEKEGTLEDGIDFVSIVTPNNSHFPIAKAFLEKGINVVCDKPLTTNADEAVLLEKLAAEKGLLFGVTYTYTGYPMIKQAREMILQGEIGDIRFVNAEYPQDWLSEPVERDPANKQAAWRADPKQSGISNCVGDIGSHVENLVSTVTGLEIDRLCARLDRIVEGRVLDDNATIMLDYRGGAKGVYWSSQIAIGHDNDLQIRIYGSKGSLFWRQEAPDSLTFSKLGAPIQILTRGRDSLYPRAAAFSRVPAGHPEGYFEALGNIYTTFIRALRKKAAGEILEEEDLDFPPVSAGLHGVKFIEKCVESSQKDCAWIKF